MSHSPFYILCKTGSSSRKIEMKTSQVTLDRFLFPFSLRLFRLKKELQHGTLVERRFGAFIFRRLRRKVLLLLLLKCGHAGKTGDEKAAFEFVSYLIGTASNFFKDKITTKGKLNPEASECPRGNESLINQFGHNEDA